MLNTDNKIFLIPTSDDKPLKIVMENQYQIDTKDNGDIEIKKELSTLEVKMLFLDILATVNVATCSSETIKYFYYCSTCNKYLDITNIDTCMNTLNEFIDYCLECGSEVINLKEYLEGD